MSLLQFNSSSTSGPSLLEKLKKAFVYLLLAASSSWGLLAPTAASAGFFTDLLLKFTPQAVASADDPNSQNMVLPAPATNIDPNPSSGGGGVSVVGGSALLPQDGPSGTGADITEQAAPASVSVYVVRPGDSLSTIAQMYDVSVNTIKWANDLATRPIQPGQELVILPVSGLYHTVKAGDTVASLAKKYSADADEILEHNDIEGALVAGEKLLIPNGTIAAAPVQKPAARSGSGVAVSAGSPAGSSNYIKPVSGVITQGLHGNNGIDIGAPEGTPVYAAAAGTVIVARTGWNGGYGNYVVVQHQRSQTLYAHLSQISVSSGSSVPQGQKIGAVGHTGKVYGATGNHLHFEVIGAANPFAR